MTEILRGETPEDINQKCLDVCHRYMDGIWRDITADQLSVSRISGGFTNLTFRCSLTGGAEPVADEPRDVFVRFYGPKWIPETEADERLSDVIVNLLASEHDLGPKIYGIFSDGMIGQYIHSHHMSLDDQKNPQLIREFARKLAKYHSLRVPTSRDTLDWHRRTFEDFYNRAHKVTPGLDQMLREVNANNFLDNDLREENQWLHRCIDAIGSPTVFSHNDIFAGNILVNNQIREGSDTNVTLIDFEYSCYLQRGFDLGFFVNEFGRTANWADRQKLPLPDDQWIRELLGHYLDESVRIHGQEYAQKPENQMDYLLREVKFFALVEDMFIIVFFYFTAD
ncbi:unnamed protein product, partial [Medioppia subpectinata]